MNEKRIFGGRERYQSQNINDDFNFHKNIGNGHNVDANAVFRNGSAVSGNSTTANGYQSENHMTNGYQRYQPTNGYGYQSNGQNHDANEQQARMQQDLRNGQNQRMFNDRDRYQQQQSYGQQPRQRQRRQKHMPMTKTELELFDENEHIKQGEGFDDQFGTDRDGDIVLSGGNGSFNDHHYIQSFEQCNFSNELVQNIRLRKYKIPTQVQKATIPLIQGTKSNLMAHAPTGTGKTAAFLLPIINDIQSINKSKIAAAQAKGQSSYSLTNRDTPYCLIVVPVKELAEQLFEEARTFAARTGVTTARSYGDMPFKRSLEYKENGCDIFVVTCGRLRHHIEDGHINLSNLRYLILDEGDKLISDGNFNSSIRAVLSHPDLNDAHRILMFSATFNQMVQIVAEDLLHKNYYFLRVGALNQAVITIQQCFVEVPKLKKQEFLEEILRNGASLKTLPGGSNSQTFIVPIHKTIIFVEEKRHADRLTLSLVYKKYNAISLNGDRTLRQRMQTMNSFKSGHNDILIATNVAARGLNIPDVGHVINYDLPENEDDVDMFIHRIGRTGRVGNVGLATSFFDPTNFDNMAKVQYYVDVLRSVNQEVPPFLLKYAGEKLESEQEQMYAESRQPGEREDAWGCAATQATSTSSSGSFSNNSNGGMPTGNNWPNQPPQTWKNNNIFDGDDDDSDNGEFEQSAVTREVLQKLNQQRPQMRQQNGWDPQDNYGHFHNPDNNYQQQNGQNAAAQDDDNDSW